MHWEDNYKYSIMISAFAYNGKNGIGGESMLWSERVGSNVIGKTEGGQWYVRPYYWAGVYRKGKLRLGNSLSLFATRDAALQYARRCTTGLPSVLVPVLVVEYSVGH